jgi:hypothetical protein
MIFIYLLEGHPDLGPLVKSLHAAMQNRRSRLFTSAFTAGEVLAGLEKLHATELLAVAQEFFSSSQVETVPFDLAAAKIYGSVRAQIHISAQDAIQAICPGHSFYCWPRRQTLVGRCEAPRFRCQNSVSELYL